MNPGPTTIQNTTTTNVVGGLNRALTSPAVPITVGGATSYGNTYTTSGPISSGTSQIRFGYGNPGTTTTYTTPAPAAATYVSTAVPATRTYTTPAAPVTTYVQQPVVEVREGTE